PKVKGEIKALQEQYGHFPVCIAKTQMSFSTNPMAKGAPTGHTVEITEARLANGAGFIVVIAGNMMTMPGLPKVPAAERIDITDEGVITGLF
ncbi:MAG: formate--tetrahydrofolate ligase, partial [Methyloprofundus sp.]|nr:formate--tetrahydrofolate ligase [Methyloprofundus sp.]